MRARNWPRRILVVLLVSGVAVASLVKEAPVESSNLELTSMASATGNELRVEGTVEVSEAFRVGSVNIGVASRAEPGSGTPGAPVRLATPTSRASTSLDRDDWTLTFDLVQETDAIGVFEASLAFNDEPAGVIVVAAATRDSSVLLVFDIGPDLPSSSAYVLLVRPAEDPVQGLAYEIASDPSGRLVWVGRGELAGEENPKLAARAGETLRVTWTNEDGIPHDLVVLSSDGSVTAGPTPIIDTTGERATLAWTAPAPGDYTYACRIHRTTMWGEVQVR